MAGDLIKDNLCAITMPASTIALSITPSVSSAPVESDEILDDSTYYSSICFKCLPEYTKPSSDLQNKLSWIWKYSYCIQHCQTKQEYFLCWYCHTHQKSSGLYQTTYAISSTINHLKKEIDGHSIIKEGPIIAVCSIAKKWKLIEILQFLHDVP